MHVTSLKNPTQTQPVVSVLMTVFNTSDYLAEAIRSVIQQETSCCWELIIVDDGSTDDSYEIAAMYASCSAGRIRLFQHAGGENRGISESRNLALAHAAGSFIAFLDSDDVWLPWHLQVLLAVLKRVPEAAAVFAGAERWVSFNEPFNEAKARRAWWGHNYLPPLVPPGEDTGLLPQGKLLQWFLKDESMVPCICSMLVRADAVRGVGGFVNEFRGLYDDQAFHAKLSLHFPLYAIDVCVARYRRHQTSCCAVNHHNESVSRAERSRFLGFVQQYRQRLQEAVNTSSGFSMSRQ